MPSNAPAIEPNLVLNPEVRTQVVELLAGAKTIVDDARKAGRDLTDEEHEQVSASMTKAKQLELDNYAERAKASGNFNAPLNDIRLSSQPWESPAGGPQAKARGASWAKAMIRAASDPVTHQFKGLTPSGSVLVDVPAPPPIELGRPVTSLRQLMINEPSSGQFAFLRQTVRTNNAAVVAPGALKPTSIYNFERVEDRCRVVAHLSEPIPRQDLSDAPVLAQFVQVEMFDGLERALEAEIIGGDGTGEHFTGLNATSGVQTVALLGATGVDLVHTLRRAITRLENYGLTGTGWVMNPADWENVETLATTGGELLLANAGQNVPVDQAARRLWGIPVVTSVSCPVGTAYLADWIGSVRCYVREQNMISWSENVWLPDGLGAGQGVGTFETNQVVARAEGRFGFAVLRPSGIVKVSLAA